MTTEQWPDADELEMLRATVRRFLAQDGGLAGLAELGLLGLLTPEDAGGGGWLPVEACVVAEEAGRALTGLPWAGSVVAAAAAGAGGLGSDVVDALLAGAVAGALARPGALTLDEGASTVTGTATVGGAGEGAVLVVVDDVAGRLLLVDGRGPGVDVALAADAFDTTRPSAVATFAGAAVSVVDGDVAARIADAATLAAAADALGALAGTAVAVREHLVERRAFERSIASFQVIQHRLADLEVVEAAAAALVARAARALASGAPDASRLVAAAHAHVAGHVPAALDDAIQLSGGIGFTWEWPAHHAMRRAMVDASLPRRPAVSRARIAAPAGAAAPPTAEPEADAAFRARARALIAEHAPYAAREGHRAPESPEQEAAMRSWYRTLYRHGLLGASWPVEWGGDPAHEPVHELIVTQELIRARAPRPIDQVQLASHVLLRFGTDEQQARYLPRIREGLDIWCQLFSEPDAGSDLAGIKARAERQPDGRWLLSGQKTWTTDGHWAQQGLALLRTTPGIGRHAGITAFVVPMDAPGLEVRPKLTMGGHYEFNDVFLDGVVLDADAAVGPVDGGWGVAMSGLEIERFGVGGNVVILERLVDDLRALAGGIVVDGVALAARDDVRDRIAELDADAQAARAFIEGHVERALQGREGEADASIAKVLHTEAYNRIGRYGAELAAAHAPLDDTVADRAARLVDDFLWSRAMTIAGGSNEVMRNIIAKRRLRLPSS